MGEMSNENNVQFDMFALREIGGSVEKNYSWEPPSVSIFSMLLRVGAGYRPAPHKRHTYRGVPLQTLLTLFDNKY